MRLRTATLALVLATLSADRGRAALFEGQRLLGCQARISEAARALVSGRREALARCVEKALRCPAALASRSTAADDGCLALAAARCQARLAAVRRAELRLESAGPHCLAPAPLGLGVSLDGFFGEAGLSFGVMGAFCPQLTVAPADAADASRCQRHALTCSADGALSVVAPRAAELLTRLGVPLGDGAGCLLASLCGNGVLDGEEECDDGPANSDTTADACRKTCVEAGCGDGVVDTGEECDDGNLVAGDGCEADCSPTLGAFCGEECDGGPVAPAEAPGDLVRCQEAILKVGAGLFARTRTAVERCVGAIGHCTMAIPEAKDPFGDRASACLARAERRCEAAARSRDLLRARLLARVATRCQSREPTGPIPLARLLDPVTGLGFRDVAATCAASGPEPAALWDLVECVYRRLECLAENVVARSIPRAYDLLWEINMDADEVFPCVTDPDDVE